MNCFLLPSCSPPCFSGQIYAEYLAAEKNHFSDSIIRAEREQLPHYFHGIFSVQVKLLFIHEMRFTIFSHLHSNKQSIKSFVSVCVLRNMRDNKDHSLGEPIEFSYARKFRENVANWKRSLRNQIVDFVLFSVWNLLYWSMKTISLAIFQCELAYCRNIPIIFCTSFPIAIYLLVSMCSSYVLCSNETLPWKDDLFYYGKPRNK